VDSIAVVEAPEGGSAVQPTFLGVTYSSAAEASKIALLLDGIDIEDVAGRASCETAAGNPVATCTLGMAVGGIRIAGQPIEIPPEPIPMNATVPINLDVAVNALGLTLAVPVTGNLTLNDVKVTGENTSPLIFEHAPVALQASGKVSVLGLGIVGLEVDIKDYEKMGLPPAILNIHFINSALHAVAGPGLPSS
jgi:hypothetical protein